MDINGIIVSIVQGICEIIPVSSSACMAVAQHMLHIPDITLTGKVALHAGSLIAIMIFFCKEIKEIVVTTFKSPKKLKNTYFLPLCIGTVPLVIATLCSYNYVKHFNNYKITGYICIIFGLFLFFADKFFPVKKQSNQQISISKSVIVGIFQAISIISGVSRLGICITACRMMSFNRKQAVLFSLMLAMPSIFGSLCFMFTPEIFSLAMLRWIAIVAFVSLIVIKPLTLYMERYGFFGILICRIIIGIILILSN